MDTALDFQKRFRLLEDNRLAVIVIAILGAGIGVLMTTTPRIGLALYLLPLSIFAITTSPKYGLFLIAAFLPFERLTAISADMTAIKFLSIFTVAAWILDLKKTRRVFVNLRNPSRLCLGLFLAIAALSLSQAGSAPTGFAALIALFLLAGLYLTAADLLRNDDDLRRIKIILISSGSLAGALLIADRFFGVIGRLGDYLDPNYSALNLVAIAPLAFGLLLQTPGSRRYRFWPALALLVGGVFATFSRGAVLAILTTFIMIVLTRRSDRRDRRIAVAALVSIFILIAALSLLNPRFSVQDIILSHGSARFDIWTTAENIFLDNWPLGVGIGAFPRVYFQYAIHEPRILPEYVMPYVAHNLYIETAVETGVFGILAFLGFLAVTLLQLQRCRRFYVNALLDREATDCSMTVISIIGFLIASLFLSTLSIKMLWLLLAIASSQIDLLPGLNRRSLPIDRRVELSNLSE